MAKVIWTEQAIQDLDDILLYIGVDNPDAARSMAKRITRHVDQLEKHPLSGPIAADSLGTIYRQISE